MLRICPVSIILSALHNFTNMFLLSEEQTGEGWEPLKQHLFRNKSILVFNFKGSFFFPIFRKFLHVIIIIIIFLHGLSRLNCSSIDALPSFPRASTISSSSRFVVEGVFRKFCVVRSFEMVDPLLFVFGSQTRREKLVLQEWGFCGWAGKLPK